nr:reverse transcriptase domain-containing protein [Tanacetum cinerariifolium]
MMASFFQMNIASTSGSGPLPSNTIANPKGELKSITTRSGLVLDGPSVPMPPPFINLKEDEHLEETLTDPKLAEFVCNKSSKWQSTFSSHTDLTSPEVINPLSGNTTSSSPDHLLDEFADELALITFPPRNDDLPFDIESDLREIEYLLNHDPTKGMDSILEDSVDECNLADPSNHLDDTITEMFTDEHTLDYSSPPLYDDVDDDLV